VRWLGAWTAQAHAPLELLGFIAVTLVVTGLVRPSP
jgi:hypothetical protein